MTTCPEAALAPSWYELRRLCGVRSPRFDWPAWGTQEFLGAGRRLAAARPRQRAGWL